MFHQREHVLRPEGNRVLSDRLDSGGPSLRLLFPCNRARHAAMQAFVDEAVNKRAQVVNSGGGTACETLYFPAVVYPVRPGMELYTKEQFGPVVPVCAYQEEQEFLDYVTQSPNPVEGLCLAVATEPSPADGVGDAYQLL